MNIGDLRARYDSGEQTDVLAAEVGLSRVQLWRRIGRPARYLMHRPAAAPDPLTVAWAAGFFDGEGNIHIYERGNVGVGASQTTPEPLLALREAFGGDVRGRTPTDPRHKDQWFWGVRGPMAGEFLRLVRPHLRVKGPLADVALMALAQAKGRGNRLTPDDLADRRKFYLAAKALNKRGRA